MKTHTHVLHLVRKSDPMKVVTEVLFSGSDADAIARLGKIWERAPRVVPMRATASRIGQIDPIKVYDNSLALRRASLENALKAFREKKRMTA